MTSLSDLCGLGSVILALCYVFCRQRREREECAVTLIHPLTLILTLVMKDLSNFTSRFVFNTNQSSISYFAPHVC